MAKKKEEPKGELFTEERALQEMARWLEGGISQARNTIAKFRDELEKYPFHAMEWSGSAFTAGAMIKVYGHYLTWIQSATVDHKATIAGLMEQALKSTLSGAQGGSRSMSETSNICKSEETARHAAVYEQLQITNYILAEANKKSA